MMWRASATSAFRDRNLRNLRQVRHASSDRTSATARSSAGERSCSGALHTSEQDYVISGEKRLLCAAEVGVAIDCGICEIIGRNDLDCEEDREEAESRVSLIPLRTKMT